jgi:gluconolactonase
MKLWSNGSLLCGVVALCTFSQTAGLIAAPLVGESPVRGQKPKQLNATHAGEGPAWHAPSRSLYFVGDDRISRYEPDGTSHVFREPSGGANGLLLDHEGRLVACEAASRRVTRTETNGAITILAEAYEGKKFNSPNDLSIDSQGRIYFTDPRYGPRDTMEQRDADGQLIEGVYRIDSPGKVQRIIGREVERPNGLLVSPNNQHLFVADNNNNNAGGARKLWRFDLNANGSVNLESRKLIFDWKTSRGPDGLKIDSKNRLFVAAGLNKASPPHETVKPYPAGIYILSYDGKPIDFVPIPKDEVTNCAFGGPDLKTLFITAGGTLWSIATTDPGVVSFPGK